MIEKITAIDTQYSGLEACLPLGHELVTSSGLVLLVGPNGSGKTALVRLLATSLQYERHFRENGISRTWEFVKLPERDLLNLQNPKKVEDGWYFISQDIDYFFDVLKNVFKVSDFDKDRDVRFFKNEWISPEEHLHYGHLTPYAAFYAVSESAMERLRNLEQTLSQPTDYNVWRYLRPQIVGGHVYTQEFHLPQHTETQDILEGERRVYFEFNPSYHGNLQIPVSEYEQTYWDDFTRHTGKQVRHYTKPTKRLKDSPGQSLADRLEMSFADIDKFFTERLNPQFNPKIDAMREAFLPEIFPRWTYENVPDDAQLVVFMDEPTAFLDYRSTYEFMDRIQVTLGKYNQRLQIFIATNDGILIDNSPRCKYISLYSQPAQSLDRVELLRQSLGLPGTK